MTDAAPISLADESDRPTLARPESPQPQAGFWALIPCAGTGTRAAGSLPKQYQRVAGQALVLHTLAAFIAVSRIAETLVVVAPGDDFFSGPEAPPSGRWSSAMCGGSTRALSVANGLLVLQQNGAGEQDWVLVHDAARCLVTPELIDRLIDACHDDAVGGLLAHPVPDTLKLGVGDRVTLTRDRAQHWLAQTPQMFRIGSLRRALRAAGAGITDESSAVEALGLAPKLVRGSATNFKVTYPEDFALAHAVLAARARKPAGHPDYDYP
jgi:2-C-methyl-D-erythritol 4-phosphate cytidylyltransferase